MRKDARLAPLRLVVDPTSAIRRDAAYRVEHETHERFYLGGERLQCSASTAAARHAPLVALTHPAGS